jgi:hypothetical protein
MCPTKLMCDFTPSETSEPPQNENKKPIEEEYPLSWCRILLMDELTDHGNDPWIYDVDNGFFIFTLLWFTGFAMNEIVEWYFKNPSRSEMEH